MKWADPEDKDEYKAGKCFLCAAFGTVELSAITCQAAHYRENRR